MRNACHIILKTTISVLSIIISGLSIGQSQSVESCDKYLPELRQVGKEKVGPTSCLMQESRFEMQGKNFVRLDLGLDGTAEGYVKMTGPYHEYLTNGPDLIFQQAGTSTEKPRLAIAKYDRMRGAAVILVFPENKADWNGKMWVTAHGRGRSFKNGRLKVWNKYLDRENPAAAFDKIKQSMLSKGYALAVTYRTSVQDVGEIIATLDDGTLIDWAAFNETASLIKDYTYVAESVIEARLGSEPLRTYFYGHSAGARTGRSINYTPGLNLDVNGEVVYDGFLMGDTATGLWLPVLMKGGKDILFTSEQERSGFQPQIEVGHQMNTKIWIRAPERPDWVSNNYLVNKRNNAKLLLDKGFESKFRVYEVRQISHANGAQLVDGRDGEIRILDVSRLYDGVIDMVDDLVEGRNVPLSRSDWTQIGDIDDDGIIDNEAISMPEISCPLGIFYPYPIAGSTTSFAGFTGTGVEPLDAQENFVDMNRNGVWDYRETPSQAWRRLGLIGEKEDLTRRMYVECIRTSAEKLEKEGFLTKQTVSRYIEQAEKQDLNPAVLDNF